MKKIVVIGLVLLAVILAVVILIPYVQFTYDEGSFGSSDFIPEVTLCGPKPVSLAAQNNISLIRECSRKTVMQGDTWIGISIVEHGRGMDCPAGCFYKQSCRLSINDTVWVDVVNQAGNTSVNTYRDISEVLAYFENNEVNLTKDVRRLLEARNDSYPTERVRRMMLRDARQRVGYSCELVSTG